MGCHRLPRGKPDTAVPDAADWFPAVRAPSATTMLSSCKHSCRSRVNQICRANLADTTVLSTATEPTNATPHQSGNSDTSVDTCTSTRYNKPIIRSFRHRGLRRLYERDDPSRISADQLDRITLALADLDIASKPGDLDLPGYRLHPLRGDRQGSWTISISGNWRITFRFQAGDVYDVDLVDYH